MTCLGAHITLWTWETGMRLVNLEVVAPWKWLGKVNMNTYRFRRRCHHDLQILDDFLPQKLISGVLSYIKVLQVQLSTEAVLPLLCGHISMLHSLATCPGQPGLSLFALDNLKSKFFHVYHGSFPKVQNHKVMFLRTHRIN